MHKCAVLLKFLFLLAFQRQNTPFSEGKLPLERFFRGKCPFSPMKNRWTLS